MPLPYSTDSESEKQSAQQRDAIHSKGTFIYASKLQLTSRPYLGVLQLRMWLRATINGYEKI